ncbi:response regulator receiver protein [Caldicellulosiruptor kronotskyensis 2002]|uniref:Response regulator receiver protein n=1 Tax=Caldicellulosiruptor kronotskyensis (strain DSM 18902 / VKM B-2412 / 2002) TaxID=632348 RepID=E4SGZ9_CALK2|nr:response regulator [Caldicellulosiruptor kronotskyensis]ADQ47024.1 response regulator receiver protein [Caldicellulosiruptor kronotskyensis 2002]
MIVKNVLIADENEYIRKAIIEKFENSFDSVHHFVFFEAADGEEALNKIGENSIHVAIIDTNLPKISGFEVLRTIKKSSVKAHIPVILLSSNIHRATRAKAYELGAIGVIPKPFSTLEVYNMVRSLLYTQDEYLHINEVVHLISFLNEMANEHIIVVPKIIDEFLSEYFVSYHFLALNDTTKEVIYNRGFDEYEIKKVIGCLNDEDRINSSSYSIIKLNNKEETYYFIFKILNDNKRLILLKKVLELWSELNDR